MRIKPIALFAAALMLVGAGCAGVSTKPTGASFGVPVTLSIGVLTTFSDNLNVKLKQVDDSRCKPGVVCIWAGELSPVLEVTLPDSFLARELRLGAVTATSGVAAVYTFHLVGTTETTATIKVVKDTETSPRTSYKDLLRDVSVRKDALVTSPLVVSGEARGNWYFEASFPVKLLDANGKVLAQLPAQAQGEWMTTDFVPFSVTLVFEKPTTETGTLVLEKDNPSGLPEHDDSLVIPVRFSN